MSCNELHRAPQQAAANYATSGIVETNLYAQAYARTRLNGACRPREFGPSCCPASATRFPAGSTGLRQALSGPSGWAD
jgi:hypothetical protein